MAFPPGLLSPPAQTTLEARPSLLLFYCGCGAFALTLVPRIVQFPPWLTATIAIVLIIRCVLEAYRLPLPSLTLTGFLAIVFAGLIWIQYGTVFGRDAGTALAAGLLAIKFYEIRRPRDIGLVIFACFFMVMSSLLYSQVLELFVYCLIMMWVLTALLLRLHAGDTQEDHLLPILKTSGIIFLQALPMMLFLFVFFPRYTGTLSFSMGEAQIGLSDSVSPGSVAKLAKDDREAMHVRFESKIAPTPDAMYFRAMVLWHYANGTWTTDLYSSQSVKPLAPAGPSDIKQTFTVPSHNQRWLFALDVPITLPENSEEPNWAEMYNGEVIQLPPNVRLNHTARYSVFSAPFRPEVELSGAEYTESTQCPDGGHGKDHIDPRVKELTNELHKGVANEQVMSYVYNVLKYFHQGGFTYSAEPGTQGPDWLGEFLLTRKTGFCEHFASAFALMMRLQGIPARVVVGYLGGDYNPYADQWIVSQSNAHAWDEVWIPTGATWDPSKGAPPAGTMGKWMRIDPTASIGSVEPGQAAHAGDASDSLTRQVGRHESTLAEKYLPKWMRDALREMQLRREQVESSWDDLVFSYDPQVQTRLAEAMGFRRGMETVFGLMAVCLAVGGGGIFFFKRWLGRRQHVSPVENLYATFCRRMAQRGLPRASWEGPLAYTGRVAEAFPDDKEALEEVGEIVARARYGPAREEAVMPEKLKSLLNALSASQAASGSAEDR